MDGYPPHAAPPGAPLQPYFVASGSAPPRASSAMRAPLHAPAPTHAHAPHASSSSTVSIWVGDLDAWMTEEFLRSAVVSCGWGADITRIKVVRDRFTRAHAGYGFLDAASPEAAARVLQMGSGMPIPGSTRCWRLNMGRQGGAAAGAGAGAETNVYVGDLDQSVTEFQLMQTFRPRYASTRHAKVVTTPDGVSRGFGFVRFGDAAEAARAVAEMQGFQFNAKPIRLSPANGARRAAANGAGGNGAAGGSNKRPRQSSAADDPHNTTLFIGGTAPHVSEELLRREFSQFGDIAAVRIPANKTGFAFVRFRERHAAQRAMDEAAHAPLAALNPHKPVRLEWAAEQIAVRASGAGAGYGVAPLALPHHGDYGPAPPAPPAPYRIEPVRVPVGQHQLLHTLAHPTMLMPPPAVMANGATAVVVPAMDGGATNGHPHHPQPHSHQHQHQHRPQPADMAGAGAGVEPPSKKPAIDYPDDAAAGAQPFAWLAASAHHNAPQQQ